MKNTFKMAVLGPVLFVLLMLGDVAPPTAQAPLQFQLVPEAQAIFGVWRRAARRTVIVGSAVVATTATAEAVAAQQQAATAEQQAAEAKKQASAPPPPPAAAGKALPLGTVVATLPAGCTSTPVNNVNYFYCGGNFYRAVFQGNNLVYVTAQP
jgi:hypothetical protein